MSASLRAILTALAGFAAVLLVIWGVDHRIVQPAFVALERTQALEDSGRARAAIQSELRQLDSVSSDWAVWDDAYAFADNRNPVFIQSNLGDWQVLEKNSRLNLCLIFNRDGQLLYSGGYDSNLGKTVLPAAFAGESPAIWTALQPGLEQEQAHTGLLLTENGLLLLAARPILTTQGTGPARGLLVFGRFLDKALLQTLVRQTQVAFDLWPATDPRLAPEERDYLTTLQVGEPVLRPGPAGALLVYELLPDWTGQPAGLLRTPIRQDISTTARRTGQTLVATLGLMALALLLGGAYLRTRSERAAATEWSGTAWGAAALVLLIGLSLTYGLFVEWRQRSQHNLTRDFHSAAAEQTERVITTIQSSLEALNAVRHFFEGAGTVSRQQFRDFVTPILEQHPFRALEWLPRVPRDQRSVYEAAARQDGLEGFQFTEPDAEGRLTPAADRAEYFPVYYLEPRAGNAVALGFAPGPAHPARGAALEQARDHGQLAATGRYVLVQEPTSIQRFSILMFAPVYDGPVAKPEVEERRAQLRGFVLGVIRVGDVVSDALRASEPGQLMFRLLDLTADREQRWLYDHPSSTNLQTAAAANGHFHQDFDLADRIWRIEVTPSAAFVARHHDLTYRWVPATGGLLTLLTALYLFTLIAQRQGAEKLVAARTAELQTSEERYRIVALMTGQMIYDYDCQTGRIQWAGAIAALTGQDAEAFAPVDIEAWAERIHPEDRPDTLNRLRQAMEAGAPYEVEYRFACGDGAYRRIADHGAFLLDERRMATRMLGAMQDITVRREAEAALSARERRFRAMIEHAPDGIVLFNETLRYASPAVEHLLGYTPEEAMALDFDHSTHPEDLPSLLSLLSDLQGQPGRVVVTQYRFRHKDGSWRWLESTISNLIAEPSVEALVFNFRDITDRWHTEARQRLAAAVFEAAREAIFVTDADGKIIAVNPAFTMLTGYVEAEVRGRTPRLLWADRQPEVFFQDMLRTVARTGVWQGEFWARRQDGERRAALGSLGAVRDATGRILHYVGIATDITIQKAAEQHIERLAYYDALTDLPNRALLMQQAELALALAARRRISLAVLFLDLDRFKEVNDALGHSAGDVLLTQVAARLQALVRVEDMVCRLGGDEFVLLLPEADQEGALRVANKVLAALRQPFAVAGHALSATASVGIALYPHDGADFAELLKNADVALYRAKHAGRNTQMFYDRAMNVAAVERLVLETELRQAIAAGQLCAHYQPKVRLIDGALVGAEALVRWQHPARGLIPPGQFIPMAEVSDLIVALGDWMLGEVCRQLAAWRRQGRPPLTVAINLAARHFRQPGLADHLHGLLEAHGLPAQALELELTESALLETGAETAANLAQLEQLGVGLALDDFGTGYSCLSYLKHLPLDALKIDQSFVRELVTDPADRAIAATIVALGHHLALAVVAEGVETEEQRRLLIEQGCDLAQGYLFDRPLPAEAFAAAWLASARPQPD